MSPPKLLVEREDQVLTLAFNRPEKLNAIDNDLALALLDALATAHDDAVRVIRLRGQGRAFCAGRDVSQAPTDRDLELTQAVALALVHHPKPVVAAVHGWTVGAGFEWMLNADLVVAAEGTRFKLPEAALGVFVTGGLVATLPAAVGLSRAKALMLLGDAFHAADAQAWGLVTSVVPLPELDTASMTMCRRLAALSPEVAQSFKRVLNGVGLAAFDRAVDEESRVQRQLGGTAPA